MFKAPAAYKDAIQIIDKYVRPIKQNEGLNYFDQEMGGYLVLRLNREEKLSERQGLRLAAYLLGYSDSTIEKRYRAQQKLKPQPLSEPLKLMAPLALYWSLYRHNRPLSGLKPAAKHKRSEAELLNAKRCYTALTQKTVDRYKPSVTGYLKKHPRSMLHQLKAEYGVNVAAVDGDSPPFAIFALLCAAFVIKGVRVN